MECPNEHNSVGGNHIWGNPIQPGDPSKAGQVAGLYLITVVMKDVLGQQNYHLLAGLQRTWRFQILTLHKARMHRSELFSDSADTQAFHSQQIFVNVQDAAI